MTRREALGPAEWLRSSKLLTDNEASEFKIKRRFPPDFADRVFARFEAAVPVDSTHKVSSQRVIEVDSFEPPEPPILTYPGTLPTEFELQRISGYPIALYHVQEGKIFVGYRQSTLMLDEQHYYHDVSSPASKWIAPALARAPVDFSLKGTVAVMFAGGASLFSHWMFDLLPKFYVLSRAGLTPRDIDYYVVNSTNARFCWESLSRLGIPRQKIIQGSGCLISGDRLVVPSAVRHRWRTPDWAREFVLATFLPDRLSDALPSVGDRIYVSRAGARRRRITNEQEVRALLESRCFHTVFPETMQVAEFAQVVRRSAHIVAPHGAGITNVVFARSGVRVLEMFGAHIVAEGWLMTAAVGGRHYLLAGRDTSDGFPFLAVERDQIARHLRNEADYAVNLDDLSNALDIMDAP
ncbi:MAG TPA: glycosyltransferase family 61 protein [Rhizomicrobium sp.]|jgi:capsular polysaccharide biosynthesis protein|nr:glycosyltransferase family 61 protein [Rhizomicrobium sp.]